MSMCKQAKATATYEEWMTDTLASASASNAVIEGDEATLDATAATTRVGNLMRQVPQWETALAA